MEREILGIYVGLFVAILMATATATFKLATTQRTADAIIRVIEQGEIKPRFPKPTPCRRPMAAIHTRQEQIKMRGNILKPEWHEDFDKLLMSTPGGGTTHYPQPTTQVTRNKKPSSKDVSRKKQSGHGEERSVKQSTRVV
jgi:hypothetical protein